MMRQSQHAASLNWEFCKPPVDERVLDELEGILQVKFPQDLREVLRLCHGGHPSERSDFDVYHPSLGEIGACLGALVTLEPSDDVNGMLYSTRALREFHGVPPEIIPFALTGGGDYMCLDYRGDRNSPTVVFWAHEASAEESLVPLAGSFSNFLMLLESPEF